MSPPYESLDIGLTTKLDLWFWSTFRGAKVVVDVDKPKVRVAFPERTVANVGLGCFDAFCVEHGNRLL